MLDAKKRGLSVEEQKAAAKAVPLLNGDPFLSRIKAYAAAK